MLRGSPLHQILCRACAQACDQCAQACSKLGADTQMSPMRQRRARPAPQACHAMAAMDTETR
ncbi:four-helix bundle copper-binding protein [Caulobacter segnis]